MKKMIMVIFLCLSLVILAGCASIRKVSIQASEEDLKNAEATRVIAKNLLSTWKLNSGFIAGAIGENVNQLPASAVKAMIELDRLAESPDNLDDRILGYSLGLRVRALSEAVKQALKKYAPSILKYLPALL